MRCIVFITLICFSLSAYPSSDLESFVNISKDVSVKGIEGLGAISFSSSLKSGIVYEVIRTNKWKEASTLLFLGVRKKTINSNDFLKWLSGHVSETKNEYNKKCLRGYIVLATKDFEAALMNWDSERKMKECFDSVGGKQLLKDANDHMDGLIWSSPEKVPVDYMTKFNDAITKI